MGIIYNNCLSFHHRNQYNKSWWIELNIAGVPPPVTFLPTEPQVTPTKGTETTVVAPPVTERRTGELNQEQMIVIIVCVSLIVAFLIIAAVYFLVFRRWRENRGEARKWSSKLKISPRWSHRLCLRSIHARRQVAATRYTISGSRSLRVKLVLFPCREFSQSPSAWKQYHCYPELFLIVGEMDSLPALGARYSALSSHFISRVRDTLYISCRPYLTADWLDCSALITLRFSALSPDGGGYKRSRKLHGFNRDYEMNRWGFVISHMTAHLGKFLRTEMRYTVNRLHPFNNTQTLQYMWFESFIPIAVTTKLNQTEI